MGTRGWSLRDERGRPTPLLIVLAATGGILLVIVAVNRWGTPSDEHAYWLASQRLLHGEPLYDATATSVTPYAYWYPPFVAQVLAPIAAILPAMAFTAGGASFRSRARIAS